ncbi:hypothetical protein K9M16_03815, partial [Candidatus Babeliales bacterium]|nr:hypothetical protein [Candidatus Babeliales bacterium]
MFQPSQEPEGEQPERRVIRRPAGQQEKVEEEPSQERKQVITPPTGTIPTAPPLPTVVPGTVPPAPPVPTAPVIPKAPEIKTTPEIEKKLDRPSRPASFLEEIRARAGKPVKKEEKAVGDIPKAPPLPTVTSGTVPSAPSVPTAPVIPKAPEIKTAPTPEKTQPSLEGDLRARLARIAAATKKDDDDDDY